MTKPIFDPIKRMAQHERRCPLNTGGGACDCGFDMNLPEGRACADCLYLGYCTQLFCVNPQNERCDFSPAKYQPKLPTIVITPFDVVRLGRGAES